MSNQCGCPYIFRRCVVGGMREWRGEWRRRRDSAATLPDLSWRYQRDIGAAADESRKPAQRGIARSRYCAGKIRRQPPYKAVSGSGEVLRMPPVGGGLPAADIAVIKEWLDTGAPWSNTAPVMTTQWWSFKKPSRPAVPAGAVNPIDGFINQKLKAAGIAPSAEADRLTLLRRASYDLLGLPPTKDQIDEFLADKSPDAWEKVVDKLLASPRYGEKWGRHWLDLARYGATAGFEQDPYLLIAWRYRDYVIKSFNDDKPYDRFTKEQIAGDELYPTDPESRQGTGFYRV